MAQDIFKILKDLELRVVGLDPETNKMQEGYFTAFRTVGLPIHKDDFKNPFSPFGAGAASLENKLNKDIPKTDPTDPKDAAKTASGKLDETNIALANIGKSFQSYLNTFLLIDDKIKMNNQYAVMPGSSKVSDSWYAIITGANGIPTASELNDDMKKAYEKMKAVLMDKDDNPTPHYQAYMDYQEQYKDKVKAWNRAYSAAQDDPIKFQNWSREGKLYHDDADEALGKWGALGHKEEIENALATLAAQGTDPAIALISRGKKRFINSLVEFTNVGQLPYTILLPNSWYDVDNDDGWNEYTARDFHSDSHYQASSTAYGGGAVASIGLFHAGGSFDHNESTSSSNFQMNNLRIGFKYCAVDIKRPWLDTSLLNLKNWFLMGDYKKNCISTGKMAQELPQANIEPTFLPSIVTSLILIKDLDIYWDNCKENFHSFQESTGGSAAIGYGCFAISGHYKHGNETRDFSCDDTGESLRVPGIQLVGYVSTINPACPGVDSSPYLNRPVNQ